MIHNPEVVKFVLKTAEETVNNSTTYQDDNHLKLPLEPNEAVAFEVLAVTSGDVAADIKFTFATPTGASIWAESVNDDGGGTITQYQIDADGEDIFALTSGARRPVHIIGSVVNGSTAGNLQLKWAQKVADASDTKLRIGSWIKGHTIN